MLLIFFSKMQKQILDQNNFSPLNFAFLTNVQKNWLSPKSFGLAQNSCKSKVNIICNKQTIIFQKEKSQKTSLAIISLERNSSSVGYSTVNGITTPNYKAKGGFQLEFVSISCIISHMTCYTFECSHWWKIYL